MARLAALIIMIAAAMPAIAEQASFNVNIGPLRAGVLAYDGRETGGSYTMRGSARPSGLIGAIFDAEVDTVSEGRVQGNSYRPRVSKEVTRDDGDVVERVYRFSGGVPKVTRTPAKKPSSHAAPASAQGGTLDTTTAAYAILRDRPRALACDLDISIYDGTRRHRVRLNEPQETEGGLVCRGRYTRVAGFDAEDMAGQRHWPLTMEYTRRGDGTLSVSRLSFPTSYGTARIVRR